MFNCFYIRNQKCSSCEKSWEITQNAKFTANFKINVFHGLYELATFIQHAMHCDPLQSSVTVTQ